MTCPICKNEEFSENANYCKICGTRVSSKYLQINIADFKLVETINDGDYKSETYRCEKLNWRFKFQQGTYKYKDNGDKLKVYGYYVRIQNTTIGIDTSVACETLPGAVTEVNKFLLTVASEIL